VTLLIIPRFSPRAVNAPAAINNMRYNRKSITVGLDEEGDLWLQRRKQEGLACLQSCSPPFACCWGS
jgi:hypothetical protein